MMHTYFQALSGKLPRRIKFAQLAELMTYESTTSYTHQRFEKALEVVQMLVKYSMLAFEVDTRQVVCGSRYWIDYAECDRDGRAPGYVPRHDRLKDQTGEWRECSYNHPKAQPVYRDDHTQFVTTAAVAACVRAHGTTLSGFVTPALLAWLASHGETVTPTATPTPTATLAPAGTTPVDVPDDSDIVSRDHLEERYEFFNTSTKQVLRFDTEIRKVRKNKLFKSVSHGGYSLRNVGLAIKDANPYIILRLKVEDPTQSNLIRKLPQQAHAMSQ